MSTTEKEVDSLGRIVIPIEFRRRLGIKAGSRVKISFENQSIIISPLGKFCALCKKEIGEDAKISLCEHCIEVIKSKY